LKPTPLKRSLGLDDDDDEGDRKLLKLDLPSFDPEVQSGTAANVEAVTEDMAAVEGRRMRTTRPPSSRRMARTEPTPKWTSMRRKTRTHWTPS
jgi:hypothetical protein